jgi:uncharacterized protein YndB with AHSA1/START domain
MDVRPGGTWRLTMFVPPHNRRIDRSGEYREAEAPARLVFTIAGDLPHGTPACAMDKRRLCQGRAAAGGVESRESAANASNPARPTARRIVANTRLQNVARIRSTGGPAPT